jgi:hypothetical protein
MRVNRARVSLSVLGLAVIGSQAGHLLTYALRFGGAAQTQQSTGAHAYFPAIVKPVLGVAAMAVLATLLVVGFARLGAGRRVPHEPAPSFLRLLAVLYTVQLAFFALQETAEAVFSGAPPNSVEVLILWGTVGQLPVAVIAALALRWLLVRLRPALLLLRSRFESAFQLLPYTSALVLVPVETETAIASDGFANMLNPRGPPSS